VVLWFIGSTTTSHKKYKALGKYNGLPEGISRDIKRVEGIGKLLKVTRDFIFAFL
jgi:hypothetical protein